MGKKKRKVEKVIEKRNGWLFFFLCKVQSKKGE